LQALYNDTIAFINQTDDAIVEHDMFTVFKDDNGLTLDQLKKY
jgi:hypothetical protein